MLQTVSIRSQIDGLTAQGNRFLAEASQSGNQSAYLKAIQDFGLSYKYALLLNCQDGTEQVCAFNLGQAHIAGGDTSRGITLLKTVLDHGGWPERHEITDKDTYKGDIYFNLALGYEKVSETENALKCYMNALLQYDHDEDARKVAETYLKMAKISNSQKDFAEARRNFELAARAYTKVDDKINVAMALTCQVNAGILDRTFAREECVRLLDTCCNLCGKLDSKGLQGKILCEVGLLYYKLGCLERALLCFEKSVNLCEVAHVQRRAVALQNAGSILNALGYFEEAIPRHAESARLHGHLTNRNAQGQSFCNLAFANSQLGNYEESWESYLHALKAFEDSGDRQGQWQCHEGLGAIAFNGGRIHKAVEHFNKALACQTEAISDGSRQRVLSKLSNALNLVQQEITDVKKPLAIDNGTESSRRKSDKKSKESSSEDDVVDSKPSTSKPRQSTKKRKIKGFERGRREYADESDRPIKHIARGISNLTYYSNPYAESQTYVERSSSESDIPDFLADVHLTPRPQSSLDGSLYAEKRNDAPFHKNPTRKKRIRGLVQATTMPINALTVPAEHRNEPSSSMSDTREAAAATTITAGVGSTAVIENSLKSDSSGHEKPAAYYKRQLPKINENKSGEDDDSYTSVTDRSTSSSSSSEDEADGSSDRSVCAAATYANRNMAKALTSDVPTPDGENLDSTHLYASIKPRKNDTATIPKNAVQDAGKEEFSLAIEDDCSGEDIPPVLSVYTPKKDEGTESSSSATSKDRSDAYSSSSSSHSSHSPDPVEQPKKKKKKSKDKSDKSRSCVIM